ncbi:ATP-binding cassette domain-containing protein [Nocardia sp. NPDC005825]|uniref:ABC transporter ATP-binding protein n=1 Tax=unclassified Nocardia TaxID=2637762 RepID=UPI0033F3CB3F
MSTQPVVVEHLTLIDERTGTAVLDDFSATLPAATITGLTGVSGSGKTTLMKALTGWLPSSISRASGSIRVDGAPVFELGSRELRTLRRTRLTFVGQDPGSALNPTMRVRALLAEFAADTTAIHDALARVGLSPELSDRRPTQLSGGQQRRVALARALLRDTMIVVIDEPFAGLDAHARRTVAGLLREIAHEGGKTVLVSGHDLLALESLADQTIHLGGARFTAPATQHRLLPTPPVDSNLLSARGIGVQRSGRSLISDIDLTAPAGRITAILGESGAGKTTLARALAGLEPTTTGTLAVRGRTVSLNGRRRGGAAYTRIQLVPQNPLSTLNPQRTIEQILERPLSRNGVRNRARRAAAVTAALEAVDLSPRLRTRRSPELSGGQRQRVSIARALAGEPDVLICDEVTSALDSATADNVMNLLATVAADTGIAVLAISHDLALLARHCAAGIVVHEGTVAAAGPMPALLGHLGIRTVDSASST